MAETPPVQCPSCGSENVVAVSLWLFPARYYECRGCQVSFRRLDPPRDPADVARLTDWLTPRDHPEE